MWGTWRGRAAAETEQRAADRSAVVQSLDCGLKMSTAALQLPVLASTPPAKRSSPEGKASRGGREAAAAAEREVDRADCDQEQE